MTIHHTHPFADPDPDPVRRLRGRLGGSVTLWTTGEGRGRAGLTVTSLMVARGETERILALVDPDSDFAEQVGDSGSAVVTLLEWADRDLAEVFAGLAPAPGGPFRQADFEQTPWGPRLTRARTWAGVSVEETSTIGWSSLLTFRIEEVQVVEETEPLGHRRGRYHRDTVGP